MDYIFFTFYPPIHIVERNFLMVASYYTDGAKYRKSRVFELASFFHLVRFYKHLLQIAFNFILTTDLSIHIVHAHY